MVGLPVRSSSTIRSASVSARADSDVPQVRSTRLRITAFSPERSTRSGMMVPFTMICIS